MLLKYFHDRQTTIQKIAYESESIAQQFRADESDLWSIFFA